MSKVRTFAPINLILVIAAAVAGQPAHAGLFSTTPPDAFLQADICSPYSKVIAAQTGKNYGGCTIKEFAEILSVDGQQSGHFIGCNSSRPDFCLFR